MMNTNIAWDGIEMVPRGWMTKKFSKGKGLVQVEIRHCMESGQQWNWNTKQFLLKTTWIDLIAVQAELEAVLITKKEKKTISLFFLQGLFRNKYKVQL